MQKITPFLWFDGQAEEAARFYVAVFANAEVVNVARYGDGAPVPKGTVMTATFLLEGQEFVALNGGPMFSFSPAISFVVNCDTQAEVDHYWTRLSEGGEQQQCGWVKDRFGVSWQIVPRVLGALLADPHAGKAERVMGAMLQMGKLDIAALERAGRGGS